MTAKGWKPHEQATVPAFFVACRWACMYPLQRRVPYTRFTLGEVKEWLLKFHTCCLK